METLLNRVWYLNHWLVYVLLPLSWLYCAIVRLRRLAYRLGLKRVTAHETPILVVGNLTVGGTGKTPAVIALTEILKTHGYRPAVITRGYGGNARHWPQQVRADSDAYSVGDEAVVIANRTGCPVVAGPIRNDNIAALGEHTDCDIILSDDGLQHLAMARTLDIVVVDGQRRFGNGHCLPAGPLREPRQRIDAADIVISYGSGERGEFVMSYTPDEPRSLHDGHRKPAEFFAGEPIHAIAGIGNPTRFYATLKRLGLELIEHDFPDHHRFSAADLAFDDEYPVIMTEKDAVKCVRFARPGLWYLPVTAELPPTLTTRLLVQLKKQAV